jgi:hypothetical protein
VKTAALLLAIALAAAGGARAAERLDDTASPRSRVTPRVVLSDEGRPLITSRKPTRAVVQVGRVDYRLNTARYAGRGARIYFVVPAQINGLRSPAGLRVDWRDGHLFAPGSARPGERQLVWTGVVPGPWITESLDLSFEVELAQLQLQADGQFGFEPYFEIETAP